MDLSCCNLFDSVRCLRVLALIVGFLGMCLTGTIYTFTSFEDDLLYAFNFTRKQGAAIFSIGVVGSTAGFPGAWIHKNRGPFILNLISFLMPTIGYAALYSTVKLRAFYHYHAYLVGLFYFVAGHGSSYLYKTSLLTAVRNFSPSSRGKIIGLLHSGYLLGTGVVLLIYKSAFPFHPTSWSEDRTALGCIILFLVTSHAVLGFLALCLIKRLKAPPEELSAGAGGAGGARKSRISVRISPDVGDQSSEALEYSEEPELPPERLSESESVTDDTAPIVSINNQYQDRHRAINQRPISTANNRPPTTSRQHSLAATRSVDSNSEDGLIFPKSMKSYRLLNHCRFHYTIWPFLFISAPSMSFVLSAPKIFQSAGHFDSVISAVLMVVWSGAVTSFLLGVVSDYWRGSFPRINWFLFCVIGQLGALAGVIVFPQYLTLLRVLCVFTGVSIGASLCIVPTVLSEEYGVRYFGMNWAWLYFAWGVLVLCFWAAFLGIYLSYVPQAWNPGFDTDDLICRAGGECYRWYLLLILGFEIVGVILMCGLVNEDQSD